MKHHGEVALVASETVEKVWQHILYIQELIKKYGYQLHDIFNTGESALFYV